MTRGHFGIGVERSKKEVNVGTLFRTANILGASYVFVIGARYSVQSSDTMKTYRHLPLLQFPDFATFRACHVYDTPLIGIELDERAVPLDRFVHPERAVYLLGAEDHGLSSEAIEACHALIRLPGDRSMNVAVAGSIVLYDRVTRGTGAIRAALAGAVA